MELLLRAIEISEQSNDFAFNQFDLMEKIGQEVHIVRETSKNKATFNKVVEAVDSIKPFVDLNLLNQYYSDSVMEDEDEWFLRNLWGSQCEGWAPECEVEDWYDSDDEFKVVKEDWFKACPFKYEYGGTGDYYTILRRLEDQ